MNIPENKWKDERMTRESNTIFIGSKPVMNYVLAVVTLLGSGGREVTLKARGRAITTAVDVAEITRRRFVDNLKLLKVNIGSEEMPLREEEEPDQSQP